MPFGAQILPDGRIEFNLWAPDAERVALRLVDGGRQIDLPMDGADGWFRLATASARVGSLYHFLIDGGLAVPDPASRYQPCDVHGPSQVIDPAGWRWTDRDWRGRPWHEAVIYELHVGTFTSAGTFGGVRERLDYLAELGITAIELMPLADFPGRCNWGYDGALLYAPDSRYGTPDDLKALIQAAHEKGLMVLLDVVYNHFGPEGNYLHTYNQSFFAPDKHTPWGAAINFDGDGSDRVRQFFIHNALYWLEEYHFDGLRFDAVDSISDQSVPHILDELAQTVRGHFGSSRHIHLVLENDDNNAGLLKRNADETAPCYDAQWNDDIHHALHVLLTGEQGGYYRDFAEQPLQHVGRCLAEGFAYQGSPSEYRGGRQRGESSSHLPPAAFVSFLQNHDQVGNRPIGERLTDTLTDHRRIRSVVAMLLLAPAPPMLFMGEEWAARTPFPFFCDLSADFSGHVFAGRLKGFARFPEFRHLDLERQMPDPAVEQTFLSAVLDWSEPHRPAHGQWLAYYRTLIRLRHVEIIPRLERMSNIRSRYRLLTEQLLFVDWQLADGATLTLLANAGDAETRVPEPAPGRLLFVSEANAEPALGQGRLPAWTAAWFLA